MPGALRTPITETGLLTETRLPLHRTAIAGEVPDVAALDSARSSSRGLANETRANQRAAGLEA